MVTRWHLINLPVRLVGRARHWTVVENVVISWPAGQVEGFTLHSGPFRTLFLPVGPGVAITPTGIEFAHRGLVERRSRRWVKQKIREDWVTRRIPVHDALDQLLGNIKDAVIDEKTVEVTDLVISQGLLADLLAGSLRLPLATLALNENGPEETKIHELGHAKREADKTPK